jgi:citrate synthase
MMTTESPKESAVVKGLKGIKAADSFVCLVNGTEGKLLYSGYDIDDLARNSSFEEVAYLLLNGKLPRQAELDEFKSQLTAAATLNDGERAFLQSLPKDVLPMTALRSAVSISGIYDPDGEDISPDGAYRISVRLIAKIATLVAAIHRLRLGQPTSCRCSTAAIRRRTKPGRWT